MSTALHIFPNTFGQFHLTFLLQVSLWVSSPPFFQSAGFFPFLLQFSSTHTPKHPGSHSSPCLRGWLAHTAPLPQTPLRPSGWLPSLHSSPCLGSWLQTWSAPGPGMEAVTELHVKPVHTQQLLPHLHLNGLKKDCPFPPAYLAWRDMVRDWQGASKGPQACTNCKRPGSQMKSLNPSQLWGSQDS